MPETSADVVKRYLQAAITGAKTSETHFVALAEEDAAEVKPFLTECAQLSRHHQEQLTNRLSSLGESVSGAKGLLAHIFDRTPRPISTTHHGVTQFARSVIPSLTVEHNQIALYEALAIFSEAAGDTDTAALVRVLQREEREMAARLPSIFSNVLADLLRLP